MTAETPAQAGEIAKHECKICGAIILGGFTHEPGCDDMARSELAKYWRRYGRPRNRLEWVRWDLEGVKKQ